MASPASRRLARLEATHGLGDIAMWARRDITECPDWMLLSILTGRRFSQGEATAMQGCPAVDAEIRAYLAKVAVGAAGEEVDPADFALSLEWLRTRTPKPHPHPGGAR